MARPIGADSEETFTSLVGAARASLDEDGLELSLRGVARRAGVRLSTLQYYFPKKRDLLESVLGGSYRRLRDVVEGCRGALARGAPLGDVVPGLTVEFLRVARQHRSLCRARLVSNLIAGSMSTSSVRSLEHAVDALGAEGDRTEAVLATHTLSVLVLRYAAHTPAELQTLLGCRTEGEAQLLVEQHVAHLAAVLADRVAPA